MRPGQIPLTTEPADESVRQDLNCPTCGSPWHVDAAACGSCGWRLPSADQPGTLRGPCPQCHQSKYVDSLTGRCIRCDPIQIDDIQPELQAYAQRARSQRYWGLVTGVVTIPLSLVFYTVTEAIAFLLIPVILTPLFIGISLYAFMRKRKILVRYYRLGFVMRYVKPIDAELRYDLRQGKNSRKCYFDLCRLGPDSIWRGVKKNKIRVDDPAQGDEQLVNNKYSPTHLDFWLQLSKGANPNEPDRFWAKVYFDPDQSGSAVIRIADRVFVSAAENYEIY